MLSRQVLLSQRDLDAELDSLCDSLNALKVTDLKAKLKARDA